MTSKKKRAPSNEKPISLYPLTVEEALKRVMQAKPPKQRTVKKGKPTSAEPEP